MKAKALNNKSAYMAPAIEVIEVENEGSVMSASAPGVGNGGTVPFNTRSSRSSWSDAQKTAGPLSDLEDTLNDLFTVRK